jgi:hypothetical protein
LAKEFKKASRLDDESEKKETDITGTEIKASEKKITEGL